MGTGRRLTGTTFFEVPSRAQSVVYVIDRSASMGLHGALERAKRELLASLDRLVPTALFQVIVYNSRAQPLRFDLPGLVPATPENKVLIAQALAELQAEGGTRQDQALPRALALQPDVVYFLTDAGDLTETQVRSMTQGNRRRCVIHVIELTTGKRAGAEMPLQLLARENAGVYHAVDLDN
jgi:hypothetical protein